MKTNNKKDEKIEWIKKHSMVLAFLSVSILAIFIVGVIFDNPSLVKANTTFAFVVLIICRNYMMSSIRKDI